MKTTAANLTAGSLDLFSTLARDAGNWSGMPLLPILTAAEKGNLTDLKQKGLLTTEVDWDDPNLVWVSFTEAGKALALELGIDAYLR